MLMDNREQLTRWGFKFGRSGAHGARSMMIAELQELFSRYPAHTTQQVYQQAIVECNSLFKSTENSRKLTYGHLVDLYGLSPDILLFRVFRQLWELSEASQPVLALQLAVVRDGLLRSSVPVILGLQPGMFLARTEMEACLATDDPTRFSPASLKSIAQNINGTWTQAGYLSGRAKKYRATPPVSYVNVAFALFLAHCQGLSGQRLFSSEWCRLLDRGVHDLHELAHAASLRGLLSFKQASEVIEVTFPHLKLPEQG